MGGIFRHAKKLGVSREKNELTRKESMKQEKKMKDGKVKKLNAKIK